MTGRPAPDISVRLLCTSIPVIFFNARTDADGRITRWSNTQQGYGENSAFVQSHGGVSLTLDYMIQHYASRDGGDVGTTTWKLEFDTGSYYGAGNTFFPKVELTFLVRDREHFHVPLLLGPYSYTTYRGS